MLGWEVAGVRVSIIWCSDESSQGVGMYSLVLDVSRPIWCGVATCMMQDVLHALILIS